MPNWLLDRISFKHNPCGLYRDIHVTEGHSRVHTCSYFEKVASSIEDL